jgi:hypothetical protein
MDRKIHMVGVHGLFGGPGSAQYSLGIDAMFRKAVRLAPERISFSTFEQYEDPNTYADMVAAHRGGKLVVGSGHSLGAPDIVNCAHRLAAEHGATIPLIMLYDGTWNAPSPPIRNSIRRAINYFGTGMSFLGHDQIKPATGFTGYLVNIGVLAPHINVDDDLGAHTTFVREIQWLLSPTEGSAVVAGGQRSTELPADKMARYFSTT